MGIPKLAATETTTAPPLRAAAKSSGFSPSLIGTRLRERRLERGITLRQFAREIEVSASFISQLETGKAQPSVATFYSICAALDISIDELFNCVETDESTSDFANECTHVSNNSWLPVDRRIPSAIPRLHVESDSSPVVRQDERKALVLDSGVTWESLTSSHHDKTNFVFVRYEVGSSSTSEDRLLQHTGTEYGFIIKGSLQVTLGFDTYVLNAGDSISFDSSRPHRLYNDGDLAVEAIWVNANS
jgi:transcriptional regulator with XRE-family HTH domain/quercetin dioxygenase-like cupin family protein